MVNNSYCRALAAALIINLIVGPVWAEKQPSPDLQPSSLGIASSSQTTTVEKDGLKVTLDAISDKSRSRAYFNIDASSIGVAIFHLRIENKSQETSWLIHKDQISFIMDGKGTSLSSPKTSE